MHGRGSRNNRTNAILSAKFKKVNTFLHKNKNLFDAFVGTEELAHLEMICAIVHQLTRNMTMEELKKSGFDTYYVDHTAALWPTAAAGIPHNACEYQSKGDVITDLFEDMAADAAIVEEQLKIDSNRMGYFPIMKKILNCA